MMNSRRAATALLSTLAVLATPARGQEMARPLQPYVDAHTLAGAVTLVADRDRVLDVSAVGFADVDGGRAMTTDSLFWIASQSKPITAAAFLMLVDEGKVAPDDPVARFLPEFQDAWLAAERDDRHVLLRRPTRPVTVRDILSHTGGLPFSSKLETPTLDGLPLRDAARSYAMTPLATEPGTKYSYSNAGINTAGRIIEVVAGRPYEEFLRSRLLEPLGMVDTTFRPTPAQLQRLAKSYKPGPGGSGLAETTIGQLRYPLDDPARQPMPAGGLFSTAADLARFCRMVLNGGALDGRRYLSEASVRAMTTRQTPPEIKESYGLGWTVNGPSVGHGGAFATHMTVNQARGLVTVYLVQHDGFPGDGHAARLAFEAAAIARFAPRR